MILPIRKGNEQQGSGDAKYSLNRVTGRQYTQPEIDAIQNIGDKSVNQFTQADLAVTEGLARNYWETMGENRQKSPFFRAWFDDWRANDQTAVNVVKQAVGNAGSGQKRGVYVNNDTGWEIGISGKVYNEANHNAKATQGANVYLPYLDKIVENAILLDSRGMATGRSKSKNSLMMHDLYAVADIGNGQEVLRIQVEEMNNPNSEDTTNRAYKLTNVNVIKAGAKGSQTSTSASLVTQPLSIGTVAQLYNYVKGAGGLQNVKSAASGTTSKVVNADGTPKIVYHGTARADRVGWEFRADRATSGPMAYFTDNEQIANNYARDKKDTSLAYEDGDGSYREQFRVKIENQWGSRDIPIAKAWGYLPMDVRKAIRERAGHITFDEDADQIVYDESVNYGNGGFRDNLKYNKDNVVGALIDEWLESGNLFNRESDFMQVLDMAGVSQALVNAGLQQPYYKDPNYREEKTYAVYMNLRNPFNTENVDATLADNIEQWWAKQDQSKYEKESAGADMWDKNDTSVEDWLTRLRDDAADGTTYAWTTVPDAITDYLKQQGYDGIEDTGGKQGGEVHTVYIPFYPNQIKSATDNVGKFDAGNNDIRYSLNTSVLATQQERDIDTIANYIADQLVNNGDRAVELARALSEISGGMNVVNTARNAARLTGRESIPNSYI